MGIIKLMADHSEDACFETPEHALEEAIKLLKSEWKGATKMLIIPVKEHDGEIRIQTYNAGLKNTQLLAVAAILTDLTLVARHSDKGWED